MGDSEIYRGCSSHLLFANTLLFTRKREEPEGRKHPASHDFVGFLAMLQKRRLLFDSYLQLSRRNCSELAVFKIKERENERICQ